VDEADQLPADDQVGLQVDDPPEQLQIPVGVLQVDVGEMPLQRVVGQRAQVVFRGQVRGKLKRADTDVARSDAGQHRAGQRPFPKNPLARGRHRQAPGGRDAQPVHGLADDVFPQHRAQGGAAVAAPGIQRRPRAFELDVHAPPAGRDVLAQHDGPAVTQHGEVPELMPGVRLRQRLGAVGHRVARQHRRARSRAQRVRVQPELLGQLLV